MRSKPMGTEQRPPHAEWFAGAPLVDQDRHMRQHHRVETVLFVSRAGAIERHETAHKKERLALGQVASKWHGQGADGHRIETGHDARTCACP